MMLSEAVFWGQKHLCSFEVLRFFGGLKIVFHIGHKTVQPVFYFIGSHSSVQFDYQNVFTVICWLHAGAARSRSTTVNCIKCEIRSICCRINLSYLRLSFCSIFRAVKHILQGSSYGIWLCCKMVACVFWHGTLLTCRPTGYAFVTNRLGWNFLSSSTDAEFDILSKGLACSWALHGFSPMGLSFWWRRTMFCMLLCSFTTCEIG